MLLPKGRQLLLNPDLTSLLPLVLLSLPSASPSFWDPGSSSWREALIGLGKEQGGPGAILADGSLGPAGTPAFCASCLCVGLRSGHADS